MKLIKKFFSKLRLASRSNVFDNLRKLESWQWLDNEQATALQQQRIKNILLHAYYHVPYYSNLLRSSGVIKKSGAVELKSFGQIPLLEKDIIRTRFEDLKSDDLLKRKWHNNSSGGSTGQPVTLIQDKNYNDWVKANKMLYWSWAGYSISARRIRLWGSVKDLFEGTESFKTRLMRWLKNEVWLNAFCMTPEQMHSHVKTINAFRPVQILAYAESLYEFSRFIEQKNIHIYSPRSIMTSAGTLYPHMRDTIVRVFNSPVFNRYGSREVGDIACECSQHNGLHVCTPTHYVEVIRADGSPVNPGEVGEIVVTSLVNYAMPLIRYRIGDMGIQGEHLCPCGRTWPLLKEITGRVTDVFVRQDGTIVSPEYFIHLIGVELNSGWILKYQVVQEDYDALRILIVASESVENPKDLYCNEIKKISEGIRLVMGEDCRTEYEFVEDIAPTPSGKFHYTISKLKNF